MSHHQDSCWVICSYSLCYHDTYSTTWHQSKFYISYSCIILFTSIFILFQSNVIRWSLWTMRWEDPMSIYPVMFSSQMELILIMDAFRTAREYWKHSAISQFLNFLFSLCDFWKFFLIRFQSGFSVLTGHFVNSGSFIEDIFLIFSNILSPNIFHEEIFLLISNFFHL